MGEEPRVRQGRKVLLVLRVPPVQRALTAQLVRQAQLARPAPLVRWARRGPRVRRELPDCLAVRVLRDRLVPQAA